MLRVAKVACVLLLLSPAAGLAQGQRGSIEGIVKDTLGGVLPDATVEARSPGLVGVASTVTDAQGTYRFPSLPPGRYELTVRHQSFLTTVRSDVNLELGQVLKVEIKLLPEGVETTIRVQAESPLIDVKQNSAGGTISNEIIDRVPKQRDYTTLVTSVPGVDSETRNRGIQIDGASGADNRFFIDGIDKTDLYLGISLSTNSTGKALANDFVQEVQVNASGYGAEYRAAIGGVISAVTKSGSNQWHGGVGTYYLSNNLQGAVRPDAAAEPDQSERGAVRAGAGRCLHSLGDRGRRRRPDPSRQALVPRGLQSPGDERRSGP